MTFNKCNSVSCKNHSDGFWDVISVKKATQLVLQVLHDLKFLLISLRVYFILLIFDLCHSLSQVILICLQISELDRQGRDTRRMRIQQRRLLIFC
jgi:hypothetical protein